jgi:hypothetical protein
LSVEQPYGSTPTDGWARSEPAGYPSAPGPVPAVDTPAADGSATVGDEAGPNVEDEVGPNVEDVEASDAVAPEAVAGDSGTAATPGAVAPEYDDADRPVEERVRRQVAALDGIADRPLSEHAQRYDEVHAELQAALTEIDGESG